MKLEISGLHYRVRARAILSGIDVTLQPGVTCLLGANGAGKTTLLRAIATTLTPSAGSITLIDGPRRSSIHRSELGYVPQDFAFYPHFTCEEVVRYVAAMKQVPRTGQMEQVQSALTSTGLLEHAGEKLATLSGGTRQRVAIAQAIVNNPRLLVLDEPSAGLDPAQRRSFALLINDLGRDRIVLISTHLMEDVVEIAARLLVMNKGRIVFDGTPNELAGVKERNQLTSSLITDGYERVLSRYA